MKVSKHADRNVKYNQLFPSKMYTEREKYLSTIENGIESVVNNRCKTYTVEREDFCVKIYKKGEIICLVKL